MYRAFFESRFDARRIELEAGILLYGIYIVLNQMRAGEALTPEESTRTSAYDRICGRAQRQSAGLQVAAAQVVPPDGWLCELSLDERAHAYRGVAVSDGRCRASDKGLLPIKLEDYLSLLDWTGCCVRQGKQGSIPDNLAPILDQLGINRSLWTELVIKFDKLFSRVVGTSQ